MSDVDYFAWNLAAKRADAPCVRDDHVDLTYREFADRVDAFAAQLAHRSVRAGDVIALMLPNRIELLIGLMAAWRIGAVATPINPDLTDAEAEFQILDAGAVLVVNEGPGSPSGGRPTLDVEEMATRSVPGWVADSEMSGSDVAMLIYTSGSTGAPKGVMLTHNNLQFMSRSIAEHFSLTCDDHCLLVLPLFHVNAICVSFLAPLVAGGQLSVTGRFSVRRFFDDVARLRPTYFSAVPAIYALLVARADAAVDTSSLRFAVSGAAPISPELLARAEQMLGVRIVEGYGLTEGTCGSTCTPTNGRRKPGTVGPALPGQTVAIMDEAGALAPAGITGEVVIRGTNVMLGYLGRPDETRMTMVDGWLRTGDLGRLDEDGWLTLVGRIKDIIIRGGENIYPKEIERALENCDDVLEAAVIGAPHEVYGEVPVAYVVVYPGSSITDVELVEHLSHRLAKVKLPVAIHLVDAMPRNPVGKIDKPSLRLRHRSAAVS